MKIPTISILIADNDHYFAHGLFIELRAFLQLRGLSLCLLDRMAFPKSCVDIIFLGNSVICPPWLDELSQHGCFPHVFFIKEKLGNKSVTVHTASNALCGTGILFRHQTLQAIEHLLDKVLLSLQEVEPRRLSRQCHCTSALTHREMEVLQYLVTGMCTCDITCLLGISDKTIIAHKRNAMRKLHIRNNQELHRWMELGGASHLNNHPFASINNPPR
jgi:DNA-binding CsgD family transcriptional regulator